MSNQKGQVCEFKNDFVSNDTYQFSENVQQANTTQFPDSFVTEPIYTSPTPVGEETDNLQYVFGNLTDIQSHPSLQAMATISGPTREVPLQVPSTFRRDESESERECYRQIIQSTRSDGSYAEMFYDTESRNFDKLCGELRKEQYKEKPKRTRSSETHNLCEKRRRERIKGKMKALQELLPGPRKYPTDSASLLDDAIEYLKTLKLQIEMMYMRGRFIFQVPSRLPTGFQMPQFAPSGPGMGMGIVGLCNSGAISMMSIPPTYMQNSAAYGNLPIPQLTEAASTSSTTPIFTSGFSSSFPFPNQGEASSKDTGTLDICQPINHQSGGYSAAMENCFIQS